MFPPAGSGHEEVACDEGLPTTTEPMSPASSAMITYTDRPAVLVRCFFGRVLVELCLLVKGLALSPCLPTDMRLMTESDPLCPFFARFHACDSALYVCLSSLVRHRADPVGSTASTAPPHTGRVPRISIRIGIFRCPFFRDPLHPASTWASGDRTAQVQLVGEHFRLAAGNLCRSGQQELSHRACCQPPDSGDEVVGHDADRPAEVLRPLHEWESFCDISNPRNDPTDDERPASERQNPQKCPGDLIDHNPAGIFSISRGPRRPESRNRDPDENSHLHARAERLGDHSHRNGEGRSERSSAFIGAAYPPGNPTNAQSGCNQSPEHSNSAGHVKTLAGR